MNVKAFLGSITGWYRASFPRPAVKKKRSSAPIRIKSLQRTEPSFHVTQKNSSPDAHLVSSLCTYARLDSPSFRRWIKAIGAKWRPHRKLWETAYLCQALEERGMLRSGKVGLGFAVGREKLPALFASLGCTIVATDLPADDSNQGLWAETNQWVQDVEALNKSGLCNPDEFRQRVSFRPVNMNQIPEDLTGFDFAWSTCSFEHCGSLELGLRFLERQMDCLVPGGIAVHTTEFNLSSNEATVSDGSFVIYRLVDIESIIKRLRDQGHHVELLDLDPGCHKLDRYVDGPPYSQDKHLRLDLCGFASTSIGLIIKKRLN